MGKKEDSDYYFSILHQHNRTHHFTKYIGQSACRILDIPREDPWDFEFHFLKATLNSTKGEYRKSVEIIRHYQFYVSAVEDTLLELAYQKDTITSLVVSISHCLHYEKTTVEKLTTFIAKHPHYPRLNYLRTALELSSEQDETPIESLFRIKAIGENFIDFKQQVIFPQPNRGKHYRVDFYCEFDGRKVVIEIDGYTKVENDKEYYQKQVRRDSNLKALGLEVLHILSDELYDNSFVKKLEGIGIPRKTTRPINIHKPKRYRSPKKENSSVDEQLST
jgi:very-short-patch-repair endonuclease